MNRDYFCRFSRYNRWANSQLYTACAALSAEDYRAQRPAFFGSIHNTLNHILAADRIWLGRFEGRPSGVKRLNEILYDDLSALRQAREAEDAHIFAFTDGLSDTAIAGTLAYRNMAGEEKAQPLGWALVHFFNHQTHHRGQVHGMLSGTPVAPPPLDLISFLPEDRG